MALCGSDPVLDSSGRAALGASLEPLAKVPRGTGVRTIFAPAKLAHRAPRSRHVRAGAGVAAMFHVEHTDGTSPGRQPPAYRAMGRHRAASRTPDSGVQVARAVSVHHQRGGRVRGAAVRCPAITACASRSKVVDPG
jgi:hypothetical protein